MIGRTSFRLVVFTALLFVLAGCSLFANDDVIELEGPLLPLVLGNTWQFEEHRGDESRLDTVELTDAIEVRGDGYYPLTIDYGNYIETSQLVSDSIDSGQRVGTIFLYRAEQGGGYYEESSFFRYPIDGSTA